MRYLSENLAEILSMLAVLIGPVWIMVAVISRKPELMAVFCIVVFAALTAWMTSFFKLPDDAFYLIGLSELALCVLVKCFFDMSTRQRVDVIGKGKK